MIINGGYGLPGGILWDTEIYYHPETRYKSTQINMADQPTAAHRRPRRGPGASFISIVLHV